ncbi:transporter [bacterium]|nr:transporter [bacterium]
MKKKVVLVIGLLILSFALLNAGGMTLDNFHLFQGHTRDASVITSPYIEGGLIFDSYEYLNMFEIGVLGAYPITSKIEVGGGFGFINWSPENGDGESGLSDLMVTGKYNIMDANPKVSAGAYITLPIGEEKIGQGHLNFGAFGALRYALSAGPVLCGSLGLDFFESVTYEIVDWELEEKTEYETNIILGAGGIFPINKQLSIISEFNLWTEGEYILLSGGVDYLLNMGGHLRGMLGLGLDDGAPDFRFAGSFLFPF